MGRARFQFLFDDLPHRPSKGRVPGHKGIRVRLTRKFAEFGVLLSVFLETKVPGAHLHPSISPSPSRIVQEGLEALRVEWNGASFQDPGNPESVI